MAVTSVIVCSIVKLTNAKSSSVIVEFRCSLVTDCEVKPSKCTLTSFWEGKSSSLKLIEKVKRQT